VALNHFFSSFCIKKERRSAQVTVIYSVSLFTCTDFISAASAGNEEFTRTRVKRPPNTLFTLELVNLFTISDAVLVAV